MKKLLLSAGLVLFAMPVAQAQEAFSDYKNMQRNMQRTPLRMKPAGESEPRRSKHIERPAGLTQEEEFQRQRDEYNTRMERRRTSRIGKGRPSKQKESGFFDWLGF